LIGTIASPAAATDDDIKGAMRHLHTVITDPLYTPAQLRDINNDNTVDDELQLRWAVPISPLRRVPLSHYIIHHIEPSRGVCNVLHDLITLFGNQQLYYGSPQSPCIWFAVIPFLPYHHIINSSYAPVIDFLCHHHIPFDMGRYTCTPPATLSVFDYVARYAQGSLPRVTLYHWLAAHGAMIDVEDHIPHVINDDEKQWRLALKKDDHVHATDMGMCHTVRRL
jgi:hypothetical protein